MNFSALGSGTSLDWNPLSYGITKRQSTNTPRSTISASSPASTNKNKLCCDKCDGDHLTDKCPIFKKPRDKHPDALNRPKMGITGLGGTSGNFVVSNAKIIKQPGDGSCLFHSLVCGLPPPVIPAFTLRKKLSKWIVANPLQIIADSPLKDWIQWDTGKSVTEYATRLCRPSVWGGGIEMAVTSHIFCVNVHVYEHKSRGEFKRISCFNYEGVGGAQGTVNLLYTGGIHFDALDIPAKTPTTSSFTSIKPPRTLKQRDSYTSMGESNIVSSLPSASNPPSLRRANSSSARSLPTTPRVRESSKKVPLTPPPSTRLPTTHTPSRRNASPSPLRRMSSTSFHISNNSINTNARIQSRLNRTGSRPAAEKQSTGEFHQRSSTSNLKRTPSPWVEGKKGRTI